MRVPLDSWQVGPWNRWSYVHVADVVPVAPVRAGEARELPRGETTGGLDDDVADLLSGGFADGIAVVHDGRLVLERYAGEMDAGVAPPLPVRRQVGAGAPRRHPGRRGRLDPGSPVTEHVPEVRGSGYDGATVQHLLDMTAAVDFVEDYADFVRYDAACGWHPPVPGAGAACILDFLPGIGPASWGHGERLHYASPTTDLLGVVAQRAAGVPLADLVSRELWAPMGAEADAALAVDPGGTGVISGGFCATCVTTPGSARWSSTAAAAWCRRRGWRPRRRRRGRLRPLPPAPEQTAGRGRLRRQWWRRRRPPHGPRHPRPAHRRSTARRASSWWSCPPGPRRRTRRGRRRIAPSSGACAHRVGRG
jgi:hypothetical protein